MTSQAPVLRQVGHAYNIFIMVLTIFSLAIMVPLVLPWIDPETRSLLLIYDNVICVIFLVDFALNIRAARPTRAYFIGQRGYLDLLGSIPTLGFFQFTALLRLFRLSRVARMRRLMNPQNRHALIEDIVHNRGEYAAFITVLAAGIVLCVSSILVLQFESHSPDANITNGGDALWWAVVTITTVGYGDYYPVTPFGRLTGVFVMFTGVGIIGALASILASILVPGPSDAAPREAGPAVTPAGDSPSAAQAPSTAAAPSIAAMPSGAAPASGLDPAMSSALMDQLTQLRAEVAALREARATDSP